MLSQADEQKPNVILIEDVGFGTALIGTLKHKGLPVIGVKPEGDKITRLMREIAKFANAQVYLLKTAPGRADVETELFSFPGGRRNDLVDALSQALSYRHVARSWADWRDAKSTARVRRSGSTAGSTVSAGSTYRAVVCDVADVVFEGLPKSARPNSA